MAMQYYGPGFGAEDSEYGRKVFKFAFVLVSVTGRKTIYQTSEGMKEDLTLVLETYFNEEYGYHACFWLNRAGKQILLLDPALSEEEREDWMSLSVCKGCSPIFTLHAVKVKSRVCTKKMADGTKKKYVLQYK